MKGDELYAWQVREPDGRWSLISALISGNHMPLIHRELQVVYGLMPIAKAHARAMGQRLRLAHFILSEVLPDE